MSSMLIHKPRRVWQPPTQGSPGGYRSHGTQGTQLSSADVPREAAAVEGIPLEFVPVRLEFRTRSHSKSNSSSSSNSNSTSSSYSDCENENKACSSGHPHHAVEGCVVYAASYTSNLGPKHMQPHI